MYELIQVSDICYYFSCPSRIGLVRTGENEVVLIDSGGDSDAGKKVFRALEERSWKLRAIYNTHSHADHIGGNGYLQGKTGCRIFAKGVEHAFACTPVMEPSFLFGANPPQDLRHKFMLAKESVTEPLTEDVLPACMTAVSLPGHSFDMVGYRIGDGTFYIADALISAETLEKYRISYIWDVRAYLDTLGRINGMEAKVFLPAHAEPVKDICPLAERNRQNAEEVADRIEEICREPVCFETLLQKLFSAYGLEMDFSQYVLAGSTVRSYLTYLKNEGRVRSSFMDNRLLWEACV